MTGTIAKDDISRALERIFGAIPEEGAPTPLHTAMRIGANLGAAAMADELESPGTGDAAVLLAGLDGMADTIVASLAASPWKGGL